MGKNATLNLYTHTLYSGLCHLLPRIRYTFIMSKCRLWKSGKTLNKTIGYFQIVFPLKNILKDNNSVGFNIRICIIFVLKSIIPRYSVPVFTFNISTFQHWARTICYCYSSTNKMVHTSYIHSTEQLSWILRVKHNTR